MKKQQFKYYIIYVIYVIVLTLLRLVNFEIMVTCSLALIIALLISIENKN